MWWLWLLCNYSPLSYCPTALPYDGPPLELDDGCYLGRAQTLTYIMADGKPQAYLMPIECCAYPGTGNVKAYHDNTSLLVWFSCCYEVRMDG